MRFSENINDSQVLHPGSTADFNQVNGLAAPAGGNQLLFLRGANTGVSFQTNTVIQANTTYVLSAAIGNDTQVTNTQF